MPAARSDSWSRPCATAVWTRWASISRRSRSASVHESIRPFCRQGSIADPIEERFDLIVSIEVLEHMPIREAETAIQNFCASTDDVLFSSSPFDFREPTHVNVHGPEYWAEQFARHQFYRDVDFDASFITPWAARFRRRSEPFHRIVHDVRATVVGIVARVHAIRAPMAQTSRRGSPLTEHQRDELPGRAYGRRPGPRRTSTAGG